MEIIKMGSDSRIGFRSYGITIVFVRKDNCKYYGENKGPVREIVEQYRQNEIYLDNDSGYFKIIELNVFGYFDKIYIYLNHTFKLSARHIHPASSLLSKEYRFHSKIITGLISGQDTKSIGQSGEDIPCSKHLFNHLESLNSEENKDSHSFVLISRIKLNSNFLYELGGMYYSFVKAFLISEFDKLNKDAEGNVKAGKTCSFLFVESFGFSELILFTYWSNFSLATNTLFRLRDSLFNDDVLEAKGICDQIRKSRYKESLASMHGRPLFDSWSTSVGPLNDDFFKQDGLQLLTRWSIRPGYYSEFEKAVIDTKYVNKLEKVFGWQDSMTNNIYSTDLFKDSKEIQKFLDKNVKCIDAVNTIVSLVSPSEVEGTKSKVDFEKKRRDINIKNLYIDTSVRKDLEGKLQEMGVSYVVITRITNSIGNFNKSIRERENIPFFIYLEEYIQTILINAINAYYETFTNQIYLKKFSLRKLEQSLISICKGFETAFSNRYMHSQELSESPDTNFSYKGGIQQYLLVYEHLFRNMFVDLTGIKTPGVSLYVSGYSSTESTKHYMRLNIFQVYEPALFLVALAHEVAIHYFDLLISDMYTSLMIKGQLCTLIQKEESSLSTYSVSDILFFLDRLGTFDKQDLFHSVVYDKLFFKEQLSEDILSATVSRDVDVGLYYIGNDTFEQMAVLSDPAKDILQYLFTDIITYRTTFNNDIKLFLYWHTIYILQLVSNMRRGSNEYAEEVRSMLIRFEFLCRVEKCTINVEEYLDSITVGERITDEYKTASLIVDKISSNEQLTLLFLKDLISAMPLNFKTTNTFEKENGSIAHIQISTTLSLDKLKEKERDIIVGYLYEFYNNYPTIGASSSENNLSQNQVNKKSVITNGYGGTFFIGDKEKEDSFNKKIDFIKTIWHISYLQKGSYLNHKTKK